MVLQSVRGELKGGEEKREGRAWLGIAWEEEEEEEDESMMAVEVMKGAKDAPFRGVQPSR